MMELFVAHQGKDIIDDLTAHVFAAQQESTAAA